MGECMVSPKLIFILTIHDIEGEIMKLVSKHVVNNSIVSNSKAKYVHLQI